MADDVDEKDEDLEEGVEQPAIGQLLPGYGAHSLSLSLHFTSNRSIKSLSINQSI